MSVFAGGVDLAAVEHVCSGTGLGRERVLELMAALVDKSILTREHVPAGTTRYRLLATVREYGLSLLAEDERTRLRQLNQACYLDLAERGARDWFGPDQLQWRARIAAEHDNLRSALEFCATRPGQVQVGLRLAGALWFYWTACGLIAEGRQWLDRLLAWRRRFGKSPDRRRVPPGNRAGVR